jgi:hypothetical protein
VSRKAKDAILPSIRLAAGTPLAGALQYLFFIIPALLYYMTASRAPEWLGATLVLSKCDQAGPQQLGGHPQSFQPLRISLMIPLLAFLLSGCYLIFGNDFRFTNHSSYFLHMEPNGQDWQDFYLSVTNDNERTVNVRAGE